MQINQPSLLGNRNVILMDKEMETFDDLQSKSALKNTQLLIKTKYFKVPSWMVTGK